MNIEHIESGVTGSHRIKIYTEEKATFRHYFLEDRIATIPCRASYFAPGRVEE